MDTTSAPEEITAEDSTAGNESTDEASSAHETGTLIASEDGEASKAPTYSLYSNQTGSVTSAEQVSAAYCALSEVKGDTTGDDYDAYLDQSNGQWLLRRSSTSPGIRAICVNHGAFQRPSGSVTWISGRIMQSATEGGTGSRTVWQGDAMASLQGIGGGRSSLYQFSGGAFQGMGELATTSQATTGSGWNSLHVDVGHIGYTHGYATAYFVGVEGAYKLVKLYGYRNGGYERGTINTSGTFTFDVSTVSGYSSYWMPTTGTAFCSMTHFQGRLDSAGRTRAYHSGSQWKSDITSDYAAEASYRCMAYDQRT